MGFAIQKHFYIENKLKLMIKKEHGGKLDYKNKAQQSIRCEFLSYNAL